MFVDTYVISCSPSIDIHLIKFDDHYILQIINVHLQYILNNKIVE